MKIRIVGNCQAQVVSIALQRYFPADAIDYHFLDGSSAVKARPDGSTDEADVLIYQDVDFCLPACHGFKGRQIAVPLLELNFLWPFSDEAHPRNAAAITPFCLPGPYSRQLSDRFLNRLMQDDPAADPRTIADRYVAADYAAMARLDDLHAADKRAMTASDRRSGLNIWSVVEGSFQYTPVFWTNLHPVGPLLQAICRHVFETLGVERSQLLDDIILSVGDPLEFVQAPIHPSVIRHFGLQWCHGETRYRYFKEGRFTAWHFARRYCLFSYDAELASACQAYDMGTPAIEVVQRLGAAFLRHPESSEVAYYFSHALLATGRHTEALHAARHAVALEPDRPVYAAHLVRAVDAFLVMA